jgi:hypothetical protein
MLESGERELLREEQRALEEHLETCPDCAAFRGFRGDLRSCLREATGPALSSEFSDSVRLRCHAELETALPASQKPAPLHGSAGVPWPIWAALLVLTGLTIVFLIPGLEEFRQSQKLTLGTALVLLIILQNALMLFAAPLLMRRGRLSQIRFRQS